MKTIKLTRGKRAIVSDEDYEMVRQYRWFTRSKPYRQIYNREGISLARFIYGGVANGLIVTHKNGDILDNSRENLVARSREMVFQHRKNRKKVYLDRGRYVAKIRRLGKTWYIGSYKTQEEAIEAYERKKDEFDILMGRK